jgi:hypothetical protein
LDFTASVTARAPARSAYGEKLSHSKGFIGKSILLRVFIRRNGAWWGRLGGLAPRQDSRRYKKQIGGATNGSFGHEEESGKN